jgi:hypothetical protein
MLSDAMDTQSLLINICKMRINTLKKIALNDINILECDAKEIVLMTYIIT